MAFLTRSLFITFLLMASLHLTGLTGQGQDGGETREAQLIRSPNPGMPEEAQKAGLSGTVNVAVMVEADGHVSSIMEIMGPTWRCDAVITEASSAIRVAAREAAFTSRFIPALLNGAAVPSIAFVEFQFPVPDQIDSKKPAAQVVRTQAEPKAGAQSSAKQDLPVAARGANVGVVNGRAFYLPKPVLPQVGRAHRVEGTVKVQVFIRDNGKIASAQPMSGPKMYWTAASTAACQAKFTPTTINGKPVNIFGMIDYNFVK